MKTIIGLISFVACATLFFFGTGLHPIGFVTITALLATFTVALRLSTSRQAAIFSFFAWFIGSLNLWPYLNTTIGLPVAVSLTALALPAAVFSACVVLFRLQTIHGRLILANIIAPSLWTTFEFLQARLSPHGSFGSIAYTQMDCPPIIQTASIAGHYAISFTLFAFASLVASVFAFEISKPQRLRVLALCLVFPAIVFAWGLLRLHQSPKHLDRKETTVGLIASSDPAYDYPVKGEDATQWLEAYLQAAESITGNNVSIILLPENIASFSAAEQPAIRKRLREFAQTHNTAILVGWSRSDAETNWNEAVLFLPNQTEHTYSKRHLIPGLEDAYAKGNTPTIIKREETNWGIAICKDMDFLDIGSEYGALSTDLLLVPAWDFGVDAYLHASMATLRGVESGFAIARSARNGLLSVSDNRGRILSEKTASGEAFTTLVHTFRPSHKSTPI